MYLKLIFRDVDVNVGLGGGLESSHVVHLHEELQRDVLRPAQGLDEGQHGRVGGRAQAEVGRAGLRRAGRRAHGLDVQREAGRQHAVSGKVGFFQLTQCDARWR